MLVVLEVDDGPTKRFRVVVEALDSREDLAGFLDFDVISLADVVRDVAKVAHAGRQVTFANVRIEVIDLPTDTRVDKVAEVIAAAFELLDHLVALVVGDAV